MAVTILPKHLRQQQQPAPDPSPPPVPDAPNTIVETFANTGQFTSAKAITPNTSNTGSIKPIGRIKERYKPIWDIDAIRQQLAGLTIPPPPIEMGEGVFIVNPQLFIDGSLSSLEANNGNLSFAPEWERMVNFIEICENIKDLQK